MLRDDDGDAPQLGEASVAGSAPASRGPDCPVCGDRSEDVGPVFGRFSGRDYAVRRCPGCGFAFIADPWLEFDKIYDARYYSGQGADPLVDYGFELDNPARTVRWYEWVGIARVVTALLGDLEGRRWLDFGAGNGALVRHLRAHAGVDAVAFEEGAITTAALAQGIPFVSAGELEQLRGTFDVVTAIEVLEHTIDPVAELRRMRALLRPGGLLFVTTGNARPFADRLQRWSYIVPEIHVSFFEPRTLERAMSAAGFRPQYAKLGAGFDSILKFKVLKNARVRRRSALSDALPARLIGPLADRYARLGAHPIGWAH
jgi:SAM-dependent methyltransferase